MKPGVRTEFLPNPVDVDVEVLRLARIRGAPNGGQDHLVSADLLLVAHQEAEYAELLRREPYRSPLDVCLVVDEVDRDLTDRNHTPTRCIWLDSLMTNRRADSGFEFGHSEGLRDVVVGSLVQRGDLAVLGVVRRQHHDRDVAPRPDSAAHRQAVKVGKAKIEDYH